MNSLNIKKSHLNEDSELERNLNLENDLRRQKNFL